MKCYTSHSKIEEYLGGIDLAGTDLSSYIEAAERYIDAQTGRSFKADTVATARVFDGRGGYSLSIDDAVEITTVEVGNDQWGDSFETVTNSTSIQYYLMPNNYSAEGYPITQIGLRNRTWLCGVQNQRITAKWGYSVEVPKDIEMIATVLSSGMYYQNRGENTGAISNERIGEYQVSYADQGGFNDLKHSMEVLFTYKKIEI